ncbi:hypothetical protein LSAT2_017368, partial [Lamellibrachia satsuma]
MTPKGIVKLPTTNLKSGNTEDFYSVFAENGLTCLIGSTTTQAKGLMTVHEERFVSQEATNRSATGSQVVLCIDPQQLNQAFMREHYKLATLDETGSVSLADPSGVHESKNDETCDNQPVARHDGDTLVEQ